jgi:DNA-binding response OmpR family regulator
MMVVHQPDEDRFPREHCSSPLAEKVRRELNTSHLNDDIEFLEMIRTILVNAGYHALGTSDPDRVVRLIEDEAVEAVILDIMMPGRSGFDVLAEIRAHQGTSEVVVLMMSGLTSGEDRIRGLRLGATDYLYKPLVVEEMLIKLERFLPRKHSDVDHPPTVSLVPGLRPSYRDQQWLRLVVMEIAAMMAREELSVSTLAERLAIHRSQLYRRLCFLTGMTPSQLIMYLRLEQAARLLAERNASVAEVAHTLGFYDVPHFSRRFKARFGQSPSAFRRSKRDDVLGLNPLGETTPRPWKLLAVSGQLPAHPTEANVS